MTMAEGPLPAGLTGKRRRLSVGAATCALLVPADALAGEWIFTPRTATTLTLTDNLLLAQRNPRADLVTQFTPGLNVRRTGRRFEGTADIALTRLVYFDNSDFDRNLSQFDVLGRGVLLPEWLDVEAAFNRGQQLIAPFQAPMQTSLANVTGNVAEVSSYRFGPTLRHRFGRLGEVLLSYRHSVTEAAPGEALPGTVPVGFGLNVTDNLWDARVTTGEILPYLPLTFSHQLRESTFDVGGTDRIRSSSVQTSYPLTRTLRVNGTFGMDQNEIRNLGPGNIDGPFWQTGATWTPNQRLNLTFGYGRRFFGDNFLFDATWTHRRFALQASYNELVSTFSTRQEDVRFVRTTDPFGNPLNDPLAGANPLVIFDRAGLVEDVAVNRRLLVNIRFDHRVDSLLLSASSDRLESMTRNVRSDLSMRILNATWTRRLSPVASTGFSMIYLNSELIGMGTDPNTMLSVGPDFTYQLTARLTANLNFRHTDSTGAGIGLLQFTENRLVGVLNLTF